MPMKHYPTLLRHYDKVSLEGQSNYLLFFQLELIATVVAALLSYVIHHLHPKPLRYV